MTHPDSDKTTAHGFLTDGADVGHYRIVRQIGAGGMGEVYLARDTALNRRVALKFLPPHLARDPELRARFTREAQAAAALDHPNIVTVHEVGEHDGRPFFAMQYVEGHTLRHVAREEPLTLGEIPDLVARIADGLSQAHAQGLIHRDIKSANIILDKHRRPRILDFGLASVQGGEMLTQAGTTLGTAAYMSPEQAAGKNVDARSDLFSLGVVLYELVTGRLPFEGENAAAILHRITTAEPEPPSRHKPDVPVDLEQIISRCLAKDPAERYQSATDLAADLRRAGRAMAAAASKSETAPPSIAVLPFANMSADPENEYFADGLTEELLNVLAQNARLKVTGRTSSFAFKGKQEDLRGIGRKLGVATLLEGSVRKAGNRVRITAQLVNAEDGFHLWSKAYDRVLEDIFAIQDEIAAAVGEALHVTLLGGVSAGGPSTGGPPTTAGPEARRAPNPEVYDLVLRAKQSTRQMTGASLALARSLYRKALELDPDYAPAWSGMASALSRLGGYGYADHEASFQEARKCAKRALELGDSLATAHTTLGWIQLAYEHDFSGAGESFRKGVSLAPSNSQMVTGLATHAGAMGHYDEALPLATRAVELDPLDPESHQYQGRILLWADRPATAEGAFRRALELSPGMAAVQTLLAYSLLAQGKSEEALAEAEKEASAGYRYCALARVHYILGRREESDRAMAALVAEGEQWAMQIALAHAVREERDEAFRWLERARELRDAGIVSTRAAPGLRNLREDPRWKPFLEKIGLGD